MTPAPTVIRTILISLTTLLLTLLGGPSASAAQTSIGSESTSHARQLATTNPCPRNSDALHSTYTYDGDGLRATKTPAGGSLQKMGWDTVSGQVPLLLTDGTSNYIYGPGGTPIEQITGTTNQYFMGDQYGSTALLTGNAGNVNATWAYDAYGNTTTHTGTGTTSLLWNGQYQDTESGLYYLRVRYYESTTQQFLGRDPLVLETRMAYGYAGNEPIDNSDPSGLDWCVGNYCLGFHPMDGVNALVNIGRGASGGLTDDIANWLSPGASCTVPQNGLDQALGFSGSLFLGGEGLLSIADRLGFGNWAFDNKVLGVGSRLFGNESELGGVPGRAGLLNPAGKGPWRLGWSVNGRTGTGLTVAGIRLKTPLTDAYDWIFMGPTL